MLDDCQLQRFAGSSIHGEIRSGGLRWTCHASTARRELRTNRDVATSRSSQFDGAGSGATPSYFIPNAPDGTVHGIVFSLFDSQSKRPLLHLIRLSMRPGIPLQSSLFELTSAAFQAIQNLQPSNDMQVEIAMTILSDPSAHGVISMAKSLIDTPQMIRDIRESIGIEGIAGASRAIIAMAGKNKWR